jgi:hypothetical protein
MEYRQEKKESVQNKLVSLLNTVRKPHVFGISVFDLLVILMVILGFAKLFKWVLLHIYILFMLLIVVLFIKFDVSTKLTNYINKINSK